MIKDPLVAWSGAFPYDVLEVVGVTPDLPHQKMMEVSFELLAKRLMTSETRRAWDELRALDRRMLVDFVLYDVDLGAEIAAARASVERELDNPGEPPEVAEILQPARRLLADLAAQPPDIERPSPPDTSGVFEVGQVPSSGMLDELIRFDL